MIRRYIVFGDTAGLKTISEDDYEIKPKKHIVEKQIAEMESQLKSLERALQMLLERYNQQIADLEAKITEKKQALL